MAPKFKNTVHKNPFREDRPKKKFPFIPVITVILLITALILLTVFLTNFFGVIHLTSDNGGGYLYDKKNDITYELAPMCYSADLDKSDVYAEYGDTKYYRLYYKSESGEKLYLDPKKAIGKEDEYGTVDIYAASGFSLPSLEEFKASKALICAVELIEYAVGALNKEDTELAVKMLLENEQLEYPGGVVNDSVLVIYLGSDEFPYLQYSIRYFKTSDGTRYLYDRVTGRCVNIGEELKEKLD